MFWSWAILLYLALPVLILVSCIRVVIRATTVGRKGPTAPACEVCKYPIEGLSGWRCPECGNDLRRVGIVTRAMEVRRRGTYAGAILALTVGALDFGIVGAWLGWWAYLTWGGGFAAMGIGPTTMVTPLTPNSGAYVSIEIESTYDPTAQRSGSGLGGSVSYRLQLNDGALWILEFDTATTTAIAIDDRGQGVKLDNDVVARSTFEEFFQDAGLNPRDIAITGEISDLVGSAQTLVSIPLQDPATLGYPSFTVGATSTVNAPATATSTSTIDWEEVIQWSAVGISVSLWLGGLMWIIVRRRKLLREHGEVASIAPTNAEVG